MKNIFAIFAACSALIVSGFSCSSPDNLLSGRTGGPPGYHLVWADEFNGSGLPDSAKWGYDTYRNVDGWWNDELQYYAAARLENSRVENGRLIIAARRESTRNFSDSGGQQYTSARLVTRDKQSWTYGFFEISAKLPCGLGTWPAIWMLGTGEAWPDDGEIDIMEHVGFDEGHVYGSVHTGAYNHSLGTHRAGSTRLSDVCGRFHRYQLTWTPGRVAVSVDDEQFFEFKNDGAGKKATWPFNTPQYLVLNIAVGGTWAGAQGIDNAVFPVQMEIDYVRVYQQGSTRNP